MRLIRRIFTVKVFISIIGLFFVGLILFPYNITFEETTSSVKKEFSRIKMKRNTHAMKKANTNFKNNTKSKYEGDVSTAAEVSSENSTKSWLVEKLAPKLPKINKKIKVPENDIISQREADNIFKRWRKARRDADI